MDIGDIAARLATLEARENIRELVAEYARAVDERDFESIAAMYSDEAVFDHPMGTSHGRDEVISYYRDRMRAFGATCHSPHTHTIKIDGDEATGIVTCHAELWQDTQAIIASFRYYDRYICPQGKWQFSERRLKFYYVLPLEELSKSLNDDSRVRWPGLDPKPADIVPAFPSAP